MAESTAPLKPAGRPADTPRSPTSAAMPLPFLPFPQALRIEQLRVAGFVPVSAEAGPIVMAWHVGGRVAKRLSVCASGSVRTAR